MGMRSARVDSATVELWTTGVRSWIIQGQWTGTWMHGETLETWKVWFSLRRLRLV